MKDLQSLVLVSFFPLQTCLLHVVHVVATDTGAQPLISEDGKIILAVNGEIYNHVSLRASVGPDVKFKTHSDCEVIIPLVICLSIKRLLLFPYLIAVVSEAR